MPSVKPSAQQRAGNSQPHRNNQRRASVAQSEREYEARLAEAVRSEQKRLREEFKAREQARRAA
jgi:hypothetical protein